MTGLSFSFTDEIASNYEKSVSSSHPTKCLLVLMELGQLFNMSNTSTLYNFAKKTTLFGIPALLDNIIFYSYFLHTK